MEGNLADKDENPVANECGLAGKCGNPTGKKGHWAGNARRRWIIAEVGLAWAATIAFHYFEGRYLDIGYYYNLIAWVLLPLALILWVGRRDLAAYGLDPSKCLRDLPFVLVLLVVACLLYTTGFFLYASFLLKDYAFRWPGTSVLAKHFVFHIFVVGFPEELFYRGYMQTRLSLALPKRWSILGTRFGPGLILTSILFAVAHYLYLPTGPGRFLFFFPGLLYGYLRNRTDNIYTPTLFHALTNINYCILVQKLS
jgi:membrane protease YdiL (CAAX protease family)